MDKTAKRILEEVADLHKIPEGAYNIRLNGESEGRNSTEHIIITNREDGTGINIKILDGTVNESCCIPVVISLSGHEETVRNDFYVGENCDVQIVAGCGIHNCGSENSRHDGLHRFFIGKNSKVKYVEKHYGEKSENSEGGNIMNPSTEITLEEGSTLEMETTQIRGIDSTTRSTKAVIGAGASLVIKERLLTNGTQKAESKIEAELVGDGSSANLISRSVATDNSNISFISNIKGCARCSGHTECDSIIVDNAKILAVPALDAVHPDASLIHEAAIGKIAGEQLIKLETLGLTEKEAEEAIIEGFLK